MNIKEMIGVATGCLVLMTAGYTAALKGRWIIDGALAQEIAQQTVLQESIARERGYLQLQLDLKINRLQFLHSVSNKTDDLNLEVELLRDDVKRIRGRLAELDK